MLKKKTIITLILLMVFISCKKENNIQKNAQELINQNINILIDSVESFDFRYLPKPEKFKEIKIEKIMIGLLDSIKKNDAYYDKSSKSKNYLEFNLQPSNLIHFKSDYKINLVKINSYDADVLFIRFSNFQINENNASIEVSKILNISMTTDRYYFKRENGKWLFVKKENLGIG